MTYLSKSPFEYEHAIVVAFAVLNHTHMYTQKDLIPVIQASLIITLNY